MKALGGTAKYPGTAIAVGVYVDAASGINGVSSTLLMEGISALRRGSKPADYPEAILACDNLNTGAGIRIPGINIIGIASQSEAVPEEYTIDAPCVIAVDGLSGSIQEGELVIVDGYKGLVYIDPDPSTLIHYQQAEEQRQLRKKIFISSEHIPSRTQSGVTVYIYAHVSNEPQLAGALSSGADGLLVDLRNVRDANYLPNTALREAAGKPVTFVVEYGCEEILRATMTYCTPGQVTLASENPDLLASQLEHAMDRIVLEALQLNIDPPQVNLGGAYTAANYNPVLGQAAVIDCRQSDCATSAEESTVVIIGSSLDHIAAAVKLGARRIAVDQSFITEAKHTVLTIH